MSRSYLFIPGNNPSMLQQMDVFEADAIIIDLEDSVVEYDKDAAIDLVNNYLQQLKPTNLEIFVRINDVDHPRFLADLIAINTWNIDGIILPKATLDSLKKISSQTTKPIIPIIETPLGVLDVKEMACFPKVIGFLLGAEDLTKELGIKRSQEGKEIFYARSHIAIVAHAYNKRVIDTPYVYTKDLEGLKQDSQFAQNLGFTGKAVIHPNHVPIVNEVFMPQIEDVILAKRIIEKAKETNFGAFSLDGKMIDKPIIERSKKIIALYEKYQRK